MAWVKLVDGDPMVRVRQDGQMRWNTATHAMLGNPVSIELFHDAVAGKLGLRGIYYVGELRALYNEDMDYGIDAGEHFAGAGLTFVEDWEATPQAAQPIDPPEPGNPDMRGIVWIAIPLAALDALDIPEPEPVITAPKRKRRSRSKANG